MLLDHPYPPDQRVENEAVSLVEAGFEVTVLAIGPDNRMQDEKVNGVRVIRVKMGNKKQKKLRGTVGFFDLYSPKLFKEVQKVIAKCKVDVIHVHDLYLGRVGVWVKEKYGIPIVIDLHENYVEALSQYAWSTRFPGNMFISLNKWKKLESKWLDEADAIVTVISEMKKKYIDRGVPDNKLIVTPNTPNIRSFREFPIKNEITSKFEERTVLLYSGGFDLHRGLSTAVSAMQYLRESHPEVLLVLVGRGINEPELHDQVIKLNLQKYVCFEGWQPQENVRSYVNRADIGLIPHVKSVQTDASIPHKLGYYMSESLPVVTSNCNSLERMVVEHNVGLVFESENAEDLASKVDALLSDNSKRISYGENGKLAAESIFNWHSTIHPLINYYNKLTVS